MSGDDASVTSVDPAFAFVDAAVALGGRTIWSEGTFTVRHGELVAVIGPNGAGKTTLLRCLLGLVPPSEGAVEVLGGPIRRGDRRIGYVPQHYAETVGDAVRVRDLVRLGRTGVRWGIRPATGEEREATDEAMRACGVHGLAQRRVSELSGGQQQRVAIAQAIVGRPELLLLDEPLANLDVRGQRDVVDLLGTLAHDRGIAVVVVVHDMNPILPVLDSVVYLLDGHAHHGEVGDVVDQELLTHLYGTDVRVVRTAQGDLFTRST